MSWASKRQFLIVSILIAVLLALAAGIIIPTVYQTPSCTDRKQNQDETGVDCGGSCARLCEADALAPNIKFVRTIALGAGRTDVIASVENPNRRAAAKDVRYTVEVYGTDGTVLARHEGTIDLPPGATVPVYVPSAFAGNLAVARAFLTFDTASLAFYAYEDRRILPRYNNDAQVTGTAAPRVSASFSNPSAYAIPSVPVVATVFDAQGNAIAATQTLLPEVPPQGRAEAVFVWNEPFAVPAGRIDIVPVVSL